MFLFLFAKYHPPICSIVGDEEIQHLISWSKEGDVFSVKNPTEFARTILPQYFKHNNWQSFVRQLNSKLLLQFAI
jgi:hypothetical protein